MAVQELWVDPKEIGDLVTEANRLLNTGTYEDYHTGPRVRKRGNPCPPRLQPAGNG